MKKIIILAMVVSSCSLSKRQQHYERIHGLTRAGKVNVQIRQQNGDTVTLNGIAGQYRLNNDTLTRIK